MKIQIEFVIIPNTQMAGMMNVFKIETNKCCVSTGAEAFCNELSVEFNPNSDIIIEIK
jgi:hypothetical protein